MEEEYTIKEYAELKGYNLKAYTMRLLGRNARKIELSSKIKFPVKYKQEAGALLRGCWKKRNKKFIIYKRQPGVRIWPLFILKEVFNG